MATKKKTNIDTFLEESRPREEAEPITTKSMSAQEFELIRDLVAVIRVNLSGRDFVVVQKAERYLKEHGQ